MTEPVTEPVPLSPDPTGPTGPTGPTDPPAISRKSVGLRSERGPVLLAVMLATALIAIDATILATAVPGIVNNLGGFTQFPWLFSIYLLAQAAVVPVYGKLSDTLGRKRIMHVGIALFVLGSILCALAWSMPSLIAFRAVQGLGAGAIAPMGMTIVGDLYSLAERAKVQGYLASTWAISSVIGPSLGGLFVDYVSWRWIFLVNIPLGALAAWLLQRDFHETPVKRAHRIDYLGAALLASSSVLVVFGLLQGGIAWPWRSWQTAATLGGGLLLAVVFVFAERRAAEPILPGWVFSRRIFNGANLVSLVVGAVLIGLTSYIPLYAQEVLGHSALAAGLALGALSIGWPIAAANSGRVYLRIGFRNTGLIGVAFALTGTVLLSTIGSSTPLALVGLYCAIVGFGLGFIASPTLIAAQSSVDWDQRGVVTGVNVFARSLGSAVGIAIFGAIVNASLSRATSRAGGHADTLRGVPPDEIQHALHVVFQGSVLAAAVLAVGLLIIPRVVAGTGAPRA